MQEDEVLHFLVPRPVFHSSPPRVVFVGPEEARRKATGEGTVLAVGATPGEAYQGVDWGEAWPFHSESMEAYGEQRYADALDAVRGALERLPDHAGLHYNYACFATLAGDTGRRHFRPPGEGIESSRLPDARVPAGRDRDGTEARRLRLVVVRELDP